ncbi:FAD-dependent oxidoreductase [Mesorhizobium sp. M0016]|uniref:NAD(P)/FAD-dependent oxidoreductase n=1 Tax=Mesorhizobium sp. M0016 TaxID=2956843 RepID=UPI00333DF75C
MGAGPAGSAAAIQAAQSGLLTVLVEGSAFPRCRPGETLHPGIGSVLKQLGVATEVNTASELRHSEIKIDWAGNRSRTRFDDPSDLSQLGYQISRSKLDTILLNRAQRAGVDVRQPCRALAPILSEGRICGVETTLGPIRAAFTIDASGGVGWLRKKQSLALYRVPRGCSQGTGIVKADARTSLRGHY